MTRYDYDNLNQTELIVLCLKNGIVNAHHGVPPDDLIGLLEGRVDQHEVTDDPINYERGGMLEMMTEWSDLKDQLDCNQQCWNCPPAMATSCALINCDPGLVDKVRRGERLDGD
jgi:hypothetical protein